MQRAARMPRITETRALLAFVVVVFLFFQLPTRRRVRLEPETLHSMWKAPRDLVAEQYEVARDGMLKVEKYDPHAAAYRVGAPYWTADGQPALTASSEAYAQRLLGFVRSAFASSSMHPRLTHAVSRVAAHVPPTVATFSPRFTSSSRLGESDVPDLFRLWQALLPLPLGPPVEDLLPEIEWANPARTLTTWAGVVADDNQIDAQVSHWIGEQPASGAWAKVWQTLGRGPPRADIYRYFTMLFEGGVCADTNTVPIAHPYLWGLDAKSILHPDLEEIITILMQHIAAADETHRRIWERGVVIENATEATGATGDITDEAQTTASPPQVASSAETVEQTTPSPVHPAEVVFDAEAISPWDDFPEEHASNSSSSSLHRRGLMHSELVPPDDATSILAPGINLVVAIDFDSSIAFNWRRMEMWSFGRLRRSLGRPGSGRKLQFAHSIIAAKPYHPVFIDTLATVWETTKMGVTDDMSMTDLTGAGPFTDATLRYLLVRYGVTEKDLRGLTSNTRVGDVLILPEGAFHAPEKAMEKALSWIQVFFPSLPGSGLAKPVKDNSLWFWGAGWSSLGTGGGMRVAYSGGEVGYKEENEER